MTLVNLDPKTNLPWKKQLSLKQIIDLEFPSGKHKGVAPGSLRQAASPQREGWACPDCNERNKKAKVPVRPMGCQGLHLPKMIISKLPEIITVAVQRFDNDTGTK